MTAVTPAESGRITSNMNGDHGSSLVHYLEHFGRISAPVDPKITVFSTPEMIIEYGKSGNRKTWVHKFDPPMMAGEARKRLEEMHRVARQGLGLVSAGMLSVVVSEGDTPRERQDRAS